MKPEYSGDDQELAARRGVEFLGDDLPPEPETELSRELQASIDAIKAREDAAREAEDRKRKARQTWAKNERAGKHKPRQKTKVLDFSKAFGGYR